MNKQKNESIYAIQKRRQELIVSAIITLTTLFILLVYIMPLIFGVVTSLKTQSQASEPNAPILPMDIITYEYEFEGEAGGTFKARFQPGTDLFWF